MTEVKRDGDEGGEVVELKRKSPEAKGERSERRIGITLEDRRQHRDQLLYQFKEAKWFGAFSGEFRYLQDHVSETDRRFHQVEAGKLATIRSMDGALKNGGDARTENVAIQDWGMFQALGAFERKLAGALKIIDRSKFNRVIEAIKDLNKARERYLEGLDRKIASLKNASVQADDIRLRLRQPSAANDNADGGMKSAANY